jgi:hypothetical protein
VKVHKPDRGSTIPSNFHQFACTQSLTGHRQDTKML